MNIENKLIHVTDWRSQHEVLDKRLTKEEVRHLAGNSGKLTVKVAFELESIIRANENILSVEISSFVTGDGAAMKNMTFKLAGRHAETNAAILKVTGDVSEFLRN
jgi:hypothetical protein